MTPADLERELSAGTIRPVYLVMGDERVLADRAVKSLRTRVLSGAIADFNEDTITAGEASVDKALSAVRMAPMIAERRFVLVRSVERWESKDEAPTSAEAPLDRLTTYAQAPLDSAVLVLFASKIDSRRRLVALAKKTGFLVSCDPLDDVSLSRFIETEVAARGNNVSSNVARFLTQLAGPELGNVIDAIERLTLYVGKGAEVTEDAVAEVVVRVRETSVFTLVDAVGRRDRGRALAALAEVYDPRDRGLPLLGLLGWSVRQLLKFEAATRAGARPDDAAKAAGAPPFKARDLAAQIQKLPAPELERWLLLLAEADLALKGSKRAPDAVLATLVLAMASGS